MSNEQNAALVRRYFRECVSGASGPDQERALAIVDEALTSDFVMTYNNETDAEAMHGRERHKQFLVEHAKTGNRIDVRAADFFSVRNGRLAELRRFLDFDSFDRQLRPPAPRG